MDDKKISSPISDIVNPFAIHEGLFPDVMEAKFAIRGVLRAYFGSSSESEDDYLFFKASVVRFEEAPEFDIEFDHRKRLIIFVVQEPKGEGADAAKAQIRKELTMEYAVLASDSRGRTAMSIFRALDPKARLALVEAEKQREAETGGNHG